MSDAEDQLLKAMRADLDAQIRGGLLIDAVAVEPPSIGAGGPDSVTLTARYRRHGRAGTISAGGETILDAYAELVRRTIEERLRVSFVELVDS
jgi:hypothetical protein